MDEKMAVRDEEGTGCSIGAILAAQEQILTTGGLLTMVGSGDGRKRKKKLLVEIEAEVEPEAVEVTEAEAESEAEPEAEEIVEEIEAEVEPEAVEVTEAVEPDDTGKAVVVEAATRNITGFPYGVTEALKIAFGAAFELGTARMDVLRSPEKVTELGMRCLVCGDRRKVSQTRFVHCGHGECAPYGAVAQQVLSWVVSQSPARGEQQSRPARPQQRRHRWLSEDEKMAVRHEEFQVVADSVRSWFDGQAPETVKIALRATFYHGGLDAHLVMELLRSELHQVTASAIGVALRHRDYCVRRYGLQLFRRPSRGWSVN